MKQSCILNFNENFAGNTASDFDVNFNKELALEAKSEVALYNLQLRRKPIVMSADQELTLEIINGNPSNLTKSLANAARGTGTPLIQADNMVQNMGNVAITAVIEKGEYTKQEFLQYVADALNDEIADLNTAAVPYNGQGSLNFSNKYGAGEVDSRNILNYEFQFKEDDNGLFWGLVRNEDLSVMATDVAFGTTNSYAGNIQCEVAISKMVNKMPLEHVTGDYSGNISVAPAGVAETDLSVYVRGRDPISPCFYNRWDDKDPTLTGQKMCSFEWDWDVKPAAGVDKILNMCWWNTASSQNYNGTGATANSVLAAGNVYPYQKTIYGSGAHILGNTAGDINLLGETETLSNPSAGAIGQVPLSFLGLRRRIEVDGDSIIGANTMVLYQNTNLQTCCDGNLSYVTYPYDLDTAMEEIATFSFRSGLNPNGKNYTKFRWNFYAMDTSPLGTELGKPTKQTENKKVYYYQLLGFDVEGGGEWEVMYDSQHTNKYIPSELIDDGEAFFNAINPKNRDVAPSDSNTAQTASLGFQPLFTFQNCAETDSISNPMGTFMSTFSGNGAANTARPFITRSILNYSLSGVGELRNIFGIPETSRSRLGAGEDITALKNSQELLIGRCLKNPNLYPQHVGNYSGWTRIFGDGLRYNIEIQSLPIKCFNTRKPIQSTIGQKSNYNTLVTQGNERPIIYNVGGFMKDITDSSESYVYIDLEPNNLKYLSLDNSEKIKLNTLRVQIRRATTNEIANEIEDTALEILIQN